MPQAGVCSGERVLLLGEMCSCPLEDLGDWEEKGGVRGGTEECGWEDRELKRRTGEGETVMLLHNAGFLCALGVVGLGMHHRPRPIESKRISAYRRRTRCRHLPLPCGEPRRRPRPPSQRRGQFSSCSLVMSHLQPPRSLFPQYSKCFQCIEECPPGMRPCDLSLLS